MWHAWAWEGDVAIDHLGDVDHVSVVLNLGILCGIKLMLGEVAFCLQTLGTPQDSLCLFQSKMTYIYERELFWYIKSTKYFRERNFFRHLIASLEYPKCLFLAHCRVLSHLLHTLGQYLVFLNCENWLVLHSTLLHVWLQVTFASSKPGLLDMRNRKKEKNRPRLLSLDLFVFSVSQQRNRSSLLSLDLFGCSVSQHRNRSSLLSLDLFGCSVSQQRNRSWLLTCWNSSQLRNPSWSTSNIRNAVSTWVQVWVQGWV